MNKKRYTLLLLAALCSSLSACMVYPPRMAVYSPPVVTWAPSPPPRVEYIPVAPYRYHDRYYGYRHRY